MTIMAKAQSATDIQAHYFQNEEYDKSLLYYKKLYEQQPKNEQFYEFFISSLLKTNNHGTAIKEVKKKIKRFPSGLKYHVGLGSIYLDLKNEVKAIQQFDKAVKFLPPNVQATNNLAKAFLKISNIDYAITTYQKGKRLLKGLYGFEFELANCYAQKGAYKIVFEQYLNFLESNEHLIGTVQNKLNYLFRSGANANTKNLLRIELLKRVQKSPSNNVFNEMLIWHFIQEKQFSSAFIHSKAFDKKANEDGRRINSLANLAISNGDYSTSLTCYEYLIEKGNKYPYWNSAKVGIIKVMDIQLLSNKSLSNEDLLRLESDYINVIKELSNTPKVFELMKGLAHLQAFYLHKYDESISILKKIIDNPRVPAKDKARCKLELGDILLLQGDIWDASLSFMQIEKAYKHDELGNEAKFRNARIAFYTGDFKWAKAQLDVLKASTSKLIANDALNLSLLINDNITNDTVTKPLLIYARAELLIIQHRYEESMLALDSINNIFSDHSLGDNILFQKHLISLQQGDHELANKWLEDLINQYFKSILVDDALFAQAEIQEQYFKDNDRAQEIYKEIIMNHPGSLYSIEARKRFRKLRGDYINYN